MENVDQADQKKKSPFKFALPLILLLLVGVIGFGVYEYFRIAPRDVRFTNVTSSSVTVSWNTKSPTSATALVFKGDTLLPLTVLGLGGERFYDTRDVKAAELRAVQETSTNLFNDDEFGVSMEDISTEIEVVNMGEYYTHHVTISGLDSEKEYSFMIGDSFLYTKANDVDGVSTVETLAVPNSVEAPIPAYGSIKDAQNSEDPEMLAPVYDGIVYFNLKDDITGNRSNVYSGALNEDGNWYIDISGIRVEEGEDFLSGGVVANVIGEIAIDAGPEGKWEGEIISDIIAPAEMIVINDPLQGEFEGAGIKKVESNILGDFTFDTEAASCLFAGYCGPCYEGSLSNACTCPQSTLDSRPGCNGQESGTMEQAIDAVAKQTNKEMGGCSNNGEPGAHVYFQGACRECRWDTNRGGYLWTTSGVKDSDCADTSGRVIQPTVEEDEEEEDECSPDTSQSLIRVGAKCCRSGKVGVGRITTIPATIRGVSDGFESVKAAIDTAPRTIYCDIYGTPELESCNVPNGSGRQTANGCSAISCDDGYKLSFNGSSTRPLMECIEEEKEEVVPEEIDVDCRNLDNRGKVCKYVPFGVGSNYGGTAYYCSGTGTCVKDGDSCYIDPRYRTQTGEYQGGICIEVEDPETVVAEEPIYSDEACWKGSGVGYYRIYNEKLQRCLNNGTWKDEPSSGGSQRCLDLYEIYQGTGFKSVGNVSCNDKDDFCRLPSGGGYVDFYCDGDSWVNWADYVEEHSTTSIPAGDVQILSPGTKCLQGTCICEDGVEVGEGTGYSFCPEVGPSDCTIGTVGDTCNYSGYTCQEFVSDPEKVCNDEICAKKYYADQYASGRADELYIEVCVGNTCYSRMDNKNNLVKIGERVQCQYSSVSNLEISNPRGVSALDGLFTLASMGKVLAAVEGEGFSEYVIDPISGMVSGINPGSYIIEYEGEFYAFTIRDYNLSEGGEVEIYLDKNDNGEYDEGVDIKVSDIASKIKILTLSKTYNYELKKGFNFVTFPFLIKNEDSQSAASLLRNLNEIYGNSLFSISKYEGGRWKIVGQNTVVYGNNDFQLLPGEGYVIKAKEEITVSVIGQPVKYETTADSAPVTLFEGWNLIGLYGTGVKTYTAKTMIADINAANFTADNVSKWEKEKQSYEGFQFSEGQEYGFDFPINSLEAVFVRVLEGRGNWQPKLGSQ
jgi:hypothetical protein